MQQSSWGIIRVAAVLATISMVFFLSLVLQIPVAAAAVIAVVGSAGLWRAMQMDVVAPASPATQRATTWLLCVGLVASLILGMGLAKKYGGWDAWAIWNFHARYLTMPEHWQQVYYSGVNSHPDYPLGLPAIIGFFWSCFGGYSALVPFLFSMLIMLLTVSFLFLEAARVQPWVGGVALVVLLGCHPFVESAVSQYADTMLGLFIMTALGCIAWFRRSGARSYMVMGGLLTGAALWTKNEGALFAVVAAVFLLVSLRDKKHLLLWLAGLAIPLVVWSIHIGMAPANDLVGQQGAIADRLWDMRRTATIGQYFLELMVGRFLPLVVLLFGTGIYYWLRRRKPPAELWVVAVCMVGLLSIYQITPHNLDWHLHTSLDRLIVQLMPATVYFAVVGMRTAQWTSGAPRRAR